MEFTDAYWICKEMGWDWWTLKSQPAAFLVTVREIMRSRASREKRKKK